MSSRRLLLVHAHPDDETISCGATMARYAAEGASVTLVTCTLGEEGEILVPSLAGLAADAADQLGGYRIGELDRACAALGVTDHRFLGGAGRYRDSGMMGRPANDAPRAFWRASLDEAAGLLAEVIGEVRPQVLVTYDENGGYGHPDHIQAHRVAMRAVPLAEPGWRVSKVYWTALPRSAVRAGFEALRAADSAFEPPADPETIGVPDELVTTCVDGSAHLDAKRAAMRAHATQINVDGPFFALSNNRRRPLLGMEYFRRVQGSGPSAESDLFAGLPG